MERITNMVVENPVVIFSKSSCYMSHSIKRLFYELGANPTVNEVDEIANGREIEEALPRLDLNTVVPAVYIGGEFVGGASEIMKLHINGSLKPKLS